MLKGPSTFKVKVSRPRVFPFNQITTLTLSSALAVVCLTNPLNTPNNQFISASASNTDKTKVLVNKANVRWMQEEDQCFYICTDPDGCLFHWKFDKYVVCKKDYPESYARLKDSEVRE